jgi:hypothetical protein
MAKLTKLTIDVELLSLRVFRQTGVETVNPAYIKKALAKSLVIFTLKRLGLLFQHWFSILGQLTKFTPPPVSRSPWQ